MSRSSNRSPEPGSSRKEAGPLDLRTAHRMLPLVQSIVSEICTNHRLLTQLTPEQEALDRKRRGLGWSERDRRYNISDEIRTVEKSIDSAVTELSALGVELVDPEKGVVDFPTRINGRSAAFSWQVGEAGVQHWHYAGEGQRRPIPADWQPNLPS
ncbi:MAG: DUF2203 domain-containing protein [Fimbriiglobus sp.]